jgi:twitching motility protein PilU
MPTLEELNVPPILSQLIMNKRGIILMVGATGSGKSTTLAAMINHRNQNSPRPHHHHRGSDRVHPFAPAVHRQPARESALDTKSYANALKSVLREAPDVVLIGEIRTRETMEAAIELAGTGHLALSTLHANNAYQAMERIINLFPQAMHKTLFMDLSVYLRAILSQRLVRTKTGRAVRRWRSWSTPPYRGSDPRRTGRCRQRGHAAEQQRGHQCTFDDALLALYREGTITLEEALANADSAPNLEAKVHFG